MLSYEEQRLQNIRENEDLLKSVGLAPTRKAPPPPSKPKAVKKKKNTDDDDYSASPERELRRSGRERRPVRRDNDDSEDDYVPTPRKRQVSAVRNKSSTQWVDKPQRIQQRLGERLHDPKTFGSIPGVEVGTWWASRMDCSTAAIHAPTVAGISGNVTEGAWSVALSGGYPDDVDFGEAFTYTGAGGRDLKGTKQNPKNLRTAPQTFDQSFDNASNAALKRSAETRKPVRVIRGFKLDSKYAPATGYRYDGLYVVEKAYMTKGLTKGFLVCKYAFKRLPGQPPLPIRLDDDSEDADDGNEDEEDKEEEGQPEDEDIDDEIDGSEGDKEAEKEEDDNDLGRNSQERRKRKRQEDQDSEDNDDEEAEDEDDDEEEAEEEEREVEEAEPIVKRGRGRPRKHPIECPPQKRGPGRARKHPLPAAEGEPPRKRGPGRPRKHPLPDPQPEKRGPGRPRKNPVPKEPTAPAEDAEPESPVSKRGRGRPRKNTFFDAQVERPKEAVEPAPVKRGRGRPRKSGASDAPAPPEPELEVPMKRGRGRPRKSDPAPAAESVVTEPQPVRRGPGRPRKSLPIDTGSPIVKRGPGRPRKSGASDAPDPIAPEPTEVTPAKRGPGRPRKSNPVEAPSANAGEPEAAPVKRGPGRPRKNTITTPKPALSRRTSGRLSTHSTLTESEAAEVDELLTPAEPRRSSRRISSPQMPSRTPPVSKGKKKSAGSPATPFQSTRTTRPLSPQSATPDSAKRRRIMEVVIPTPSPAREL